MTILGREGSGELPVALCGRREGSGACCVCGCVVLLLLPFVPARASSSTIVSAVALRRSSSLLSSLWGKAACGMKLLRVLPVDVERRLSGGNTAGLAIVRAAGDDSVDEAEATEALRLGDCDC